MVALGLALGTVGMDSISALRRFTFGSVQLAQGIELVPVIMGVYGVAEVLLLAEEGIAKTQIASVKLRELLPTPEEWRRSTMPIARGSIVGFLTGLVPGPAAVLSTFISYTLEKKVSKTPEKFGTGMIEGVAGPEAANNASAAGVLVPLLTLGLPSSATAAIMLAAFEQYGIQPGPLLFQTRPDLVWTLIASLFVGNAMLLVLNLPLVGLWARVMLLPRPLLFGGVLVLASIGAYGLNRSLLDLGLLYAVGAVGLAMRLADFPLVPAVLGLVLGPLAEQQFRRAVAISEGDLTVFFTRPISATLIAAAVVVLAGPAIARALRRAKDGRP
jgi:putative tricarboxylic transport membrane protein